MNETHAALLKERDDWKRTASVWETIAGMRKDEADKLREELDQLTGIIANVIKKLKED